MCLYLIKHHSTQANRANRVCSEMRLKAGRQRNRGSIPTQTRFFFFSKASRPALWPTQSYSVRAAALPFRAGRSGREADVRNERSYTFTPPTRFHGVHRVYLQFVIHICRRRNCENVGKTCGRIKRGGNCEKEWIRRGTVRSWFVQMAD